jgi:TonB-linked SusC/RagA family outer membrane protein
MWCISNDFSRKYARGSSLLLLLVAAVLLQLIPIQVFGASPASFDQTISGVVTDEAGLPLIGVDVVAKKYPTMGTITDLDGKYTLTVPDDETALIFSFIGFRKKEIAIAGNTVIDVTMNEDAALLDEVVVVGYGRQVKRDITGSVATLSANEIREMPVPSFENAIQGQMAGVQVVESSGEPGAGPQIRVRGLGSITAGNEPLYVIDGFPVSKNVDVGLQGDNFRRTVAFRPPPANPLGTLNPNDIESIQVLKDASAAAIYGSRGSNGVILITTKRGKRTGAPSINYDGFIGTQSVFNRVDLMNADELDEYVTDARNNAYLQDVPGANINDSNADRNAKAVAAKLPARENYRIPDDFVNRTGTDTDWQDVVFNNATLQSHNLSVTGGNEKMGYYVAGGYFSQDGIVEGTGFDRYSLRMNLEANLSDKFKVGFTLNPSMTVSDILPAGAPYFAQPPGIIYSALVHSPTINPYNADGTINQRDNAGFMFTETGQAAGMVSASNPLAIIEAIDDQLNQFRTFSNIFAEWEILDGLVFRTFAGTDINYYRRNFYRASSLLFRTAAVGEPSAQASSSESINWLAEQTLSYNKTFGGLHNIAAVVGYTGQKERIDASTIVAENFPDDQVKTVSGGQITQGTAFQEEWSLVSYLGRINYSFDEKYLLSASFRSDKSSRFGAGNKTGIFPSASVGWRISEEAFLEDVKWLSEFKVRASWGQTGNFLIPNYAAIGLLNPYNYVLGGALANGIAPATISNQNLSWEKSNQINVGVELGLFDDRIFAAVDWFENTTSDLLLNVQIPSSLGFTNALQNIGEVVNKGMEITLVSRNTVGAFKWRTDFNISFINNEVTKLGPSGDPILSAGGAGIRHITRIGDPIGSFYGYKVKGIYQNQAEVDNRLPDALAPAPAPGDLYYEDINGDGRITTADRTVLGNYLPDFTYGITNRFSYKGLDLSVLIQGVEGSEVLNLTARHLGNGEGNFGSYAAWTERWRSESQPGSGRFPRADHRTSAHGNNIRESSLQVEDASYLRVRNVTLGYNVPKAALGNRVQSLRFYLTGNNLFINTDYIGFNPEVNNQSTLVNVQGEDYGAYPLNRTISFGVNITL